MFLEILLTTFLGIVIGTLTGIIPGLHVNLISVMLMSISSYLLGFIDSLILSVFITSIAVTHTFVNIIPSLFFGVPDEANALAILPAHELLLKGYGHSAIKLTLIGSLLSLITVILLIPILLPILPFIYEFLQPFMGWILLLIAIFMILKEDTLNKRFWGFIVFILSGILGTIVFTTPWLKQPLLPMLSGLFGISVLLISLNSNTKIPEQKKQEINVSRRDTIKAVISSALSGSITGIFPALGSSQAAIISMQILGKLGTYPYLILIGGINTANFVFSIATVYSIGKARNGAIAVISELIKIDIQHLVVLLCTALITGGVAVYFTLFLSMAFSKMARKINYKVMILIVISFIILLCLLFSSWIGILILFTATAIGIIPNLFGVKRSLSMGCLLMPVILFYTL